MTTQLDNDALPSPIELLDSARQKYTLAQARVRRGPPELALLSLHGSLEDALRARAIHRRLPAALAPFLQLLDGLVADDDTPLSSAEAEGIRKMHRLRARVAHGEQITVAAETIEAYQRLAARLLPRYGVLVVGPAEPPVARTEERPERSHGVTRPIGGSAPPARRQPPEEPPRRGSERRRPASTYPLLDRYPDLVPAREREDGARSWRDIDEAERTASFFERSQSWLLPLLIVVAIFLIGATISIALQSGRRPQAAPTAQVPTSFAPAITTAPAVTNASVSDGGEPGSSDGATVLSTTTAPEPTADPSGLAPGVTAYVQTDAPGLNVRAEAGAGSQIIFSLGPDTAVEVVGGPVEADGFTWWQVRGPLGEGWCAGEFLEVR